MEPQNGIILFVREFRECARFYRDIIGLEVLMEKPAIIRFRLGSMYLQVEDSEALGHSPTQNVILRENSPSISKKEEELAKKGVHLEIHDLDWGEIGFVFDPHGNKLEYFREK